MRHQETSSPIRGAVVAVGFALLLGACGQALADPPETEPDATTSTTVQEPEDVVDDAPSDSSTPEDAGTTPEDAGTVPVPELSGMTLAEARRLLAAAGLDVRALPDEIEAAIVVAQAPDPGVEADRGSTVVVDVKVVPTCNPPDPVAPGPGQTILTVLFECGTDIVAPTPGVGVARIVPEQGGEAVDRVEWTLRSLLAGPTGDEKAAGFMSAFDAETADALERVTFTDGHVVADFNDGIIVNNMGTATGMVFFNAELRRNLFQHPEVDSVEFRLNGDCAAWSGLFESDGCWVITRADWDRDLASWAELRSG